MVVNNFNYSAEGVFYVDNPIQVFSNERFRVHGYLDANGVHRYLTGRRFDPRNPGEGTLITSAEILRNIDPIVPASIDSITADTDNDGLPDLLEASLGTNPFDFDTDGDGLPDGWEVMFSGTDPLKAYTDPGVCASDRNDDGDAMAISTPSESYSPASYAA